MRERGVAALVGTCVVEQLVAADVEADDLVVQMYSLDIEGEAVVIGLAWQQPLEDCIWADLVDRRNSAVAALDGCAGQEACWEACLGLDVAYARVMLAVIWVVVFHDVDDDGGRRGLTAEATRRECPRAPETVADAVASHVGASWPEVVMASHASRQR